MHVLTMADGDYYGRKLGPGWRTVATAIAGAQPLEFIVAAATTAYARTMRLGDGVPGLTAQAEAFAVAAAGGSRERLEDVLAQTQLDSRHHPHTHAAALAAEALLESQPERLAAMTSDEASRTYVEAAVRQIAAHHLERCQADTLPVAYGSMAALRGFQQRILNAMPVGKLGTELLRHEDGQGFKAPRRAKPPVGTAAMLHRRLDVP